MFASTWLWLAFGDGVMKVGRVAQRFVIRARVALDLLQDALEFCQVLGRRSLRNQGNGFDFKNSAHLENLKESLALQNEEEGLGSDQHFWRNAAHKRAAARMNLDHSNAGEAAKGLPNGRLAQPHLRDQLSLGGEAVPGAKDTPTDKVK